MTVVSTNADKEAQSFTIVAEFAAPPVSVWQLWADPRLLERWWGPPTWPATFREYDFTPGGDSTPGGDVTPGRARRSIGRSGSAGDGMQTRPEVAERVRVARRLRHGAFEGGEGLTVGGAVERGGGHEVGEDADTVDTERFEPGLREQRREPVDVEPAR